MRTRSRLSVVLLAAGLAAAACQGREPKQDVAGGDTLGAILPPDENAPLDTSGLTEATDIALADEPASVTGVLGDTPGRTRPVPDARPAPTPPAPPPVATPEPPPAARAPSTPAPSPAPAPSRAPTAGVPATGACATPGVETQRRCLMSYLARSDVALNRTYQSIIAEMKRRAGTPPGAREPDEVERLRQSQRAWLVYRDTECRRRNRGREGPLWAPMRAQCLGEFSGAREVELAAALRRARGG